jgi:hypothetical protein
MRLIATLLTFILALSYYTLYAAEPEAPTWTFDDKDAEKELANWNARNQLEALKIEAVKDKKGEKRKVLITKSLGGDPYMYPGGNSGNADYVPFDGTVYNTIYMAIRVNMANTWQIYYYSQEEPAWNENQRQNFEVTSVDDFEDIEVRMTRGGWDKRHGIRFRIDPGTAVGVEAEIDYISLIGSPNPDQAVKPAGKLAVGWGLLKRK